MKRILAAAAAALALAASPDVARASMPTSGVITGALLGPHLNLVGLPPAFGLEVRTLSNQLGVNFDFGLVPWVKVSQAKLSWQDYSLGLRWYPWAESFYLGARYGARTFKAKATDDTNPLNPLEASAKVNGTYIAPELGWHFAWRSGFFMGIELGYQLMVSHSSSFDIPIGIDAQTQKDIDDAADKIGKIGLPILTLLQLGWYF